MTKEEAKAINTLRDSGHAVIVWTPEELGSVCPSKVSDRLVELGHEVINDLRALYEYLD